MGSTLRINQEAAWMPSGGLFGVLIGALADLIRNEQAALAEKLMFPIETGFHFLDMEEWNSLEIKRFLRALQYFQEAEWKSSGDTIFKAYGAQGQKALAELEILLCFDKRSGEQVSSKPAQFVISSQNIWQAPTWVYDLELQFFAAFVRKVDEALASKFLEARSRYENYRLDISAWSEADMSKLTEVIKILKLSYGQGLSTGICPEFRRHLYPLSLELYNALRTDKRSKLDIED